RPRGMFVSFGSASGPIEAFDLRLLTQKGSLYATRPTLNTYAANPRDLQKMARDLIRAVKNGTLEIPITAHPLKDVVAVHYALEARQTTGSIVLLP
ncbi:MAG: zinc-binding dehydrogenase, partial [Methylovirgula sp.]